MIKLKSNKVKKSRYKLVFLILLIMLFFYNFSYKFLVYTHSPDITGSIYFTDKTDVSGYRATYTTYFVKFNKIIKIVNPPEYIFSDYQFHIDPINSPKFGYFYKATDIKIEFLIDNVVFFKRELRVFPSMKNFNSKKMILSPLYIDKNLLVKASLILIDKKIHYILYGLDKVSEIENIKRIYKRIREKYYSSINKENRKIMKKIDGEISKYK